MANIDFPTFKSEGGHKIHSNAYFAGSVLKDKILKHYDPERYKIPRDGGPVYLTKDKAIECLDGKRVLEWQGKPVPPFRGCILCMKLSEWNI